MGPSAGDVVASSVRLERRLAEGGMGNVWIASHLALHTQVVVKFMHESLAKDAVARERFTKEAVAASQVKSPHVVQTFDHGVTETGLPFIVMELLEGEDLGSCLYRRGRLSLVEVASVVVQVARALSRAHERGVVHRDIKPDNIFLCEQGGSEPFVKLLDFGIARTDPTLLPATTLGGATMGTPFYMSPEQFLGARDLGYRTDLWSLGVVAFEAAVGIRPFEGDSLSALAIAVHSGPIPVPSQYDPALAPLDPWFLRACARDPRARFASAKEMADALTLIVTGEPEGPLATLRAARMEWPHADRLYTPRDATTSSADEQTPARTTADAAIVRGGSVEPSGPRPFWILSAIATVSIIVGLSMAVGIKSWVDEHRAASQGANSLAGRRLPEPVVHASASAPAATVVAKDDSKTAAAAPKERADDNPPSAATGSSAAGTEQLRAPPTSRKAPARYPITKPTSAATLSGGAVSGSQRSVGPAKTTKPSPRRDSKEEDIE